MNFLRILGLGLVLGSKELIIAVTDSVLLVNANFSMPVILYSLNRELVGKLHILLRETFSIK